jgi:hypothetical protein
MELLGVGDSLIGVLFISCVVVGLPVTVARWRRILAVGVIVKNDNESTRKDYPAIKKRLGEGWKFGQKPPGVQ